MSALMARVARLDRERVFLGLADAVPLDEVKSGDFVFGAPEIRAALPEGAVWVEQDCDLPPSRYRLAAPHDDHPHWHFVPLQDELAVSFEQMIELGLALALSHFNTAGPLGRYAREFYALTGKNFPALLAKNAKGG